MKTAAIGAAFLVVAAIGSGGAAASAPFRPCAAHGIAAWSPDGKQIAFGAGGTDRGTVCVANVDGSHLRHFSLGSYSPPDQVAWPRPDELLAMSEGSLQAISTRTGEARQLAYAQDFLYAAGEVATDMCVPEAGGAPVEVIDLSTRRHVSIGGTKLENCVSSISPDGRWLTFSSNAPDGGRAGPEWIARTDGTHLRRLAGGSGMYLFWTPAGLWRGRAVRRGIRYTLVFPRPTGRSLLVPAQVAAEPAPNGRWLSYTAARARPESKTFALYVLDTKTGRTGTVPLRNAFDAVWSPDSKQLLVTTVNRATHCLAYWRVPEPAGRPKLILGC